MPYCVVCFLLAQGSVLISPHNYLLCVETVKTFDTEFSKGATNLTNTVPDFWAYCSDIAVRQFPYNCTCRPAPVQ
ncbi:hypothetical protein K488DRAFT_91222 [Vararia minispora EC-137]|uniref:Uncharacterized protein n=1 Tax=Vararia minispora EC-137 TaxID=1314806 RepID=A0ACB8Q637_9AGAM|nr:hypothetical protein K488DRAFT_91222 [Vararia minispora EC-137]